MQAVRQLVAAALVAFALVAVSGFGFSPAKAQDGDALVRVVHASPDAPDVDVYAGGDVVLEGVPFGAVSDFLSVPAGSIDVAVVPAGGDISEAVIEATLDVEAGVAYEVVARGFVDEIEAGVYVVDNSELDSETAWVRVVHLPPDTPAVDIAVTGGDVLFTIEYPNATDYIEVPAGSYDLEFRPAGTEDVAIALPGTELTGGTVYDVLAIGSFDEGTVTVAVATYDASAASGDSASGGDDSDSGVGGETHSGDGATQAPDTGIGSLSTAGQISWLLVAVAGLFAVAGLGLRFAPKRR